MLLLAAGLLLRSPPPPAVAAFAGCCGTSPAGVSAWRYVNSAAGSSDGLPGLCPQCCTASGPVSASAGTSFGALSNRPVPPGGSTAGCPRSAFSGMGASAGEAAGWANSKGEPCSSLWPSGLWASSRASAGASLTGVCPAGMILSLSAGPSPAKTGSCSACRRGCFPRYAAGWRASVCSTARVICRTIWAVASGTSSSAA